MEHGQQQERIRSPDRQGHQPDENRSAGTSSSAPSAGEPDTFDVALMGEPLVCPVEVEHLAHTLRLSPEGAAQYLREAPVVVLERVTLRRARSVQFELGVIGLEVHIAPSTLPSHET